MNPLVPTWTEMLITLGAAGYVLALLVALLMLLQDHGLDARHRMGWLLFLLMLPIVGIISYGLVRRRQKQPTATDSNRSRLRLG